jgi:membrane-associated phospholipid phosphatase
VFRNVIMLCNALALIVYENFPVAPPRLTTDIDFDGHPFTFQDTVFGALSAGGKLVGNSVGYNEFSAMPSVHMAWAVVVGAAVVLLARPLIVRVLGALYPVLMLVAVVVTGNHFLLDAIGAVAVVLVAAAIAGSLAWWATTRRVPRLVRLAVIGEG